MSAEEKRKNEQNVENVQAWLDVIRDTGHTPAKPFREDKEPFKKDSTERRTTNRLRNIDIKGWVKKADSAEEESVDHTLARESFTLAPTRILDISPTGASIRTKNDMPPGQRLYLNLKIKTPGRDGEDVVKILCEVMRSGSAADGEEVRSVTETPWQSTFVIGLKFFSIGPHEQDILDRFFQSRK